MAEAILTSRQRIRMHGVAMAVILVLGVVLIGVTVAFLVRTTSLGADGSRIVLTFDSWTAAGVAIEPLDPDDSLLLPGDRLAAINGVTLDEIGEGLLQLPLSSDPWPVGETVNYEVLRDGEIIAVDVSLDRYPLLAVFKETWATVVVTSLILAMAIVALAIRPHSAAARAFSVLGIAAFASMPWLIGMHAGDLVDGYGFWLYYIPTSIGYPLAMVAVAHFWLVFPDTPRLVLARPWLLPALYAAPFGAVGATLMVTLFTNPTGPALLLGPSAIVAHAVALAYSVIGLVAAVWRFRTAVDPVARRQVRLVLVAMGLPLGVSLAFGLVPETILGEPLLSYDAQSALALPTPFLIGVAVIRYRLVEFDAIVSRAVVYTLLSGVIVVGYVLLVGGVGTIVQTEDNLVFSLVAIGLAAVVFQPLRQRVQRAVDRMLYGTRSEPYEVLSRLGQQLEETVAPELLLRGVVESVVSSLKTQYAAIELKSEEGFFVAAATGTEPSSVVRLPMVHQGETVGRLVVAPWEANASMSSTNERLLNDIARQAGAVAQSVRVTADLRRSREQLVIAREEERRRLRRDLHDGVGPTLANIAMRLDATRSLISDGGGSAEASLDSLKTQTQEAIGEIRRLAYELRPPALDELGLTGALEEYVARSNGANGNTSPTRVSLETPEAPLRLPAAAEVAIYRIAVEGIVNVMKHAHASDCLVSLAAEDGTAKIEITDNGIGIEVGQPAGVGLSAMRERAAELGGTCTAEPRAGGGTRVHATIPIGMAEEVAER